MSGLLIFFVFFWRLIMDFFDSIFGYGGIVETVGDFCINAVESTGMVIEKIGDSVVDTVANGADFVEQNPIKSTVIAAAAIASGSAGIAFAGQIASAFGATGALGASSTGTAIGSLSGAALESASLAALGGGSTAAGGGGMAVGTVVVGSGCTAAGTASATGVIGGINA
jgi:hypothetical protein